MKLWESCICSLVVLAINITIICALLVLICWIIKQFFPFLF